MVTQGYPKHVFFVAISISIAFHFLYFDFQIKMILTCELVNIGRLYRTAEPSVPMAINGLYICVDHQAMYR